MDTPGGHILVRHFDEERMLLGEGDFVLPSPDDDHVGEDVE